MFILLVTMATVLANKMFTRFMLLLGGHNHCVKVSSDSETVRGMGLWIFIGALRELMLMGMPNDMFIHFKSLITLVNY